MEALAPEVDVVGPKIGFNIDKGAKRVIRLRSSRSGAHTVGQLEEQRQTSGRGVPTYPSGEEAASSSNGARRLRLVHVRVQPIFMIDDGETLTPLEHPVVTIPAAEWPAYSGERFPREAAEWQARLNAGSETHGDR